MSEKLFGIGKFVKEAQRIFDENPLEKIDKEFTERELRIIEKERKRKGSDFWSVEWAKQVIRRAHYIYKLLVNEKLECSVEIIKELGELIRKADNPRFNLSKPLKKFSNKSRVLLEIFCAGDTTTTAAAAIKATLLELLEEKKGLRIRRDKAGNIFLNKK